MFNYWKVFITTALVCWCGSTLSAPGETDDYVPVTDAMIQSPPDGDWLMWRRTLDSWGYSPLDSINHSNVTKLKQVWSRDLAPGLQEGTPLVHDGTMYMINPGDIIQAIDATTGDLIWEYHRKLPEDLKKIIFAADIKRNIAIYGNLIINTSGDDYVYAVDAVSGKQVWETEVQDYRERPAQHSAGPIIADGRIISGRNCLPQGGPEACVITAHDALTGKELWRTRTMEVYSGKDDSWGGIPDNMRLQVGTWMVASYDPVLKLIYMGTSVTSPTPKFLLGGIDKPHLYHNSTLAMDPETGRIVWYYQHIIDHWDLDHTFERILVDTAVAPDPKEAVWINPVIKPGERRKVVTGIPGKTGIVYTLDRATGEFLWARPTIYQNVVSNIDGATGKVTDNPASVFTKKGDSFTICPSAAGGRNWPAGAYSPLTNAMYIPEQNVCMDATAVIDKPNPDSILGFSSRGHLAPGTDKIGTVYAISVETGRTLWKYEERAPTTSLVTTGGGLVFGGDAHGMFRAYDQDTGKVLWETDLGSQVTGFPISYAVGGKQYIAVSTGSSLATMANLMLAPELKQGTVNKLFVFTLPQK